MGVPNPQKLLKWLRRQLEIGENGQPATVIELVRIESGGRKLPKTIFKAPFEDPADMIRQIDELVDQDVAASEEPFVHFQLLPHHGGATAVIGYYPFKVQVVDYGNEGEFSPNMAMEGVHPKGLLERNQRHLEKVMQLSAPTTEQNMRFLRDEIAELRAENRQLRAERERTWALQQNLMDRQQERQIKALEAAAKSRQKDQIVQMVISLLPVIASHFIEGKLVKDLNDPLMKTITQVFGTMKTEQWEVLKGSLTTEQWIPLAAVLKKLKDDHRLAEGEFAQTVDGLMPRMPKAPEPPKMTGGFEDDD